MKRYLATIKIILAIAFVNVLCLLPSVLKAQTPDLPTCGGDNDPNPYDTCPLDTWVWIFAAVVVIFLVVQMNRNAEKRGLKAV